MGNFNCRQWGEIIVAQQTYLDNVDPIQKGVKQDGNYMVIDINEDHFVTAMKLVNEDKLIQRLTSSKYDNHLCIEYSKWVQKTYKHAWKLKKEEEIENKKLLEERERRIEARKKKKTRGRKSSHPNR